MWPVSLLPHVSLRNFAENTVEGTFVRAGEQRDEHDFHPAAAPRYIVSAEQIPGRVAQASQLVGTLLLRVGVLDERVQRLYPSERIIEVLLHRIALLEGATSSQMNVALPQTGLLQHASRTRLLQFANLVSDPMMPLMEALGSLGLMDGPPPFAAAPSHHVTVPAEMSVTRGNASALNSGPVRITGGPSTVIPGVAPDIRAAPQLAPDGGDVDVEMNPA